ncbi:MAG: hypothetical protein IJT07_04010 [Oscillospiraceae bacterium]|nr:hypothetical protein [Oscillospiraceae bacterium]
MTLLKETDTRRSRILSWLLIAFLLVWRIPFVDRGIDYLDTGFSLVNYKNVFNGAGIKGIGTFLTALIGGWIWQLLPSHHLLVYRILHLVLNAATWLAAIVYFKKYVPRNLLALAILIRAFSSKGGEMLFSYYPLTQLVLLLSIICLIEGTFRENTWLLLLSGVLCGINIFVRLPNLLFCSMVIAVAWHGIFGKHPRWLLRCLWYGLGVLLGVALVLPLVVKWLGWSGLLSSFSGFAKMAVGTASSAIRNPLGIRETSGHTIFAVIRTLGIQGFYTMIAVVPYFVLFYGLRWVLRGIVGFLDGSARMVKAATVLAALVSAILLRVQMARVIGYLPGLFAMLVSLILVFRLSKRDTKKSVLFGLCLLLSCCAVFGSDLGFSRISMLNEYAIATLIVGILYLCETGEDLIKIGKLRVTADFCRRAGYCLLACGIVIGTIRLPYTYSDANYPALTAPVDEEIVEFNGMKTSPQRAAQLEEFYELMRQPELQDKETVIFGYFPLGFAFTDTTNYFASIQPCIDWPSNSVEKLLRVIDEKEQQGVVPVIVVSHVNQNYLGQDFFTTEAKMAVLNYMLLLHPYEIYSDTENYTVYLVR